MEENEQESYPVPFLRQPIGIALAVPPKESVGSHLAQIVARVCSIAMGSVSELEYHSLLARDLKLIKLEDYESRNPRAIELKRMLSALVQKLTADR